MLGFSHRKISKTLNRPIISDYWLLHLVLINTWIRHSQSRRQINTGHCIKKYASLETVVIFFIHRQLQYQINARTFDAVILVCYFNVIILSFELKGKCKTVTYISIICCQFFCCFLSARLAQQVEQEICNPGVTGSILEQALFLHVC